jgi:hypothetical protein
MMRELGCVISLLATLAPAVVADPPEVIVTFDDGLEGWGMGPTPTILPSGGNPGANLHGTVNTPSPAGFGTSTHVAFLGDLTRYGRLTLGVDLKVNRILDLGGPAPRFFSVELISDKPERAFPQASVRRVLGMIGDPGDAEAMWARWTVTIDDPGTDELPAGWMGIGDQDEYGSSRLPPGWTSADVFRDVDSILFSTRWPWLPPPREYTSYDFQIDNIRIAGSNRPGCPPCIADHNRDGGVDGADVQAFFVDWEASLTCADSNEDGGVDAMDVATFFAEWQAGDC